MSRGERQRPDVVAETGVDLAGDVALEASDDLLLGLALAGPLQLTDPLLEILLALALVFASEGTLAALEDLVAPASLPTVMVRKGSTSSSLVPGFLAARPTFAVEI